MRITPAVESPASVDAFRGDSTKGGEGGRLRGEDSLEDLEAWRLRRSVRDRDRPPLSGRAHASFHLSGRSFFFPSLKEPSKGKPLASLVLKRDPHSTP